MQKGYVTLTNNGTDIDVPEFRVEQLEKRGWKVKKALTAKTKKAAKKEID